MTRDELIRRPFDRYMRLLEIGPSHRPIIPKADGWQTTVVDHADQAELVEKYTAMQVATPDAIEPVDYVWHTGSLSELIPAEMHGRYDGLIASHVGEHLPDLIGFLKDAATLLTQDGVIALALPDKRACFDFFQPTTMTGDVIDAHRQRRTRHRRSTIFNHSAYFTRRDGKEGWRHSNEAKPFTLGNSILDAQRAYDAASEDPEQPYQDCHAWAFTPRSFTLLMLELNLLGHIEWVIHSIEPAEGVEFYVWLKRGRIDLPVAEANAARLSILAGMMKDAGVAAAQIAAAQPNTATAVPGLTQTATDPVASWPQQPPSIAVVVPLYNGGRFIKEALESVLAQTHRPQEIIVVDDGSTDDGAGAAIVRHLAQSHPIRLVRKENGGQSSARNVGVREAQSDLIAFLDQDDAWYDNHLEELIQPFLYWSPRPIGWVYSNLDEVNEDGQLTCRNFLNTRGTAHPKRHLFDCLREDMYILPSATLVSRKAFETVGGFDETLCGYEDDDLFLRLFMAGYENIYLDMPLSRWRIHNGSTSYSYRMAHSRALYLRKLCALFPDDPMRHHFYKRDLIAPRFLMPAVNDYVATVTTGRQDVIEDAWRRMTELGGLDGDMSRSALLTLLAAYKDALKQGNDTAIRSTWRELARVSEHLPQSRTRWKVLLALLQPPIVAKSAFAVRGAVRPTMLWAFSTR